MLRRIAAAQPSPGVRLAASLARGRAAVAGARGESSRQLPVHANAPDGAQPSKQPLFARAKTNLADKPIQSRLPTAQRTSRMTAYGFDRNAKASPQDRLPTRYGAESRPHHGSQIVATSHATKFRLDRAASVTDGIFDDVEIDDLALRGRPGASIETVRVGDAQRHGRDMLAALPAWLCDALRNMAITALTDIQHDLLDAMLSDTRGHALLVRGQTGTGKSLGIVVGLLAALHRVRPLPFQKHLGAAVRHIPHALVVVPTPRLADQLRGWAERLLRDAPGWGTHAGALVRVLVPEARPEDTETAVFVRQPAPGQPPAGSDGAGAPLYASDRRQCHVLVGTPGPVLEALSAGHVGLHALATVVLDEADAMLRPMSAYAPLGRRLNRLRHPAPAMSILQTLLSAADDMRVPPRLVFASATVSRRLREDLKKARVAHDARTTLITDGAPDQDSARTHLSAPKQLPDLISHRHILLGDEDAVYSTIRRIHEMHDGASGAVFLPATASKVAFKKKLIEAGVPQVSILGMPSAPTAAPCVYVGSESDARGWDCPELQFVAVVGAATSANEHLHMCGRVGRMGRSGTAYALAKTPADLAKVLKYHSLLGIRSQVLQT